MRDQTLWIVVGAVVLLYLFEKSKATTAASSEAVQLAQIQAQQNESYAGAAAGIINDLF